MKSLLGLVFFVFAYFQLLAQATSYSDPAQAFNKMQLEKKEGSTYDRIGTYKVQGNPYLYGGGQTSSVYAKGFFVKDILKTNYNTYNQQLELVFNNDTKPEVRDNSTIDSFFVKIATTDYKADLKFFSAKIFGSKENFFLQEVFVGSKYSLYKRYKSELGYVSTNYVQSELREYDLIYDYYYVTQGTIGIKPIKLTANGIGKEFKKKVKDVSNIVEEGSLVFNPEGILLKVFLTINEL